MNTLRPSRKASPQDWHPADIKAALEKAGWTLRKLAAHYGVTANAIVRALRKRCLPAERRIADAIGVRPVVIWPTRYNSDGSRTDLRKVARPRPAVNGNLRERK